MNINITEKIKTFEDACKDQGIDPLNPKFEYSKDEEADNSGPAFERLKVIRNALLNNAKEKPIYHPYFNKNNKPGSGFFSSRYDGWREFSAVSSRLQLETSEKAIYFGSKFEKDWYQYLK